MSNLEDLTRDLATIGNGDLEQGKQLVAALAARLTHARTQHPEFERNIYFGLTVLRDDTYEMASAAASKDEEHFFDELLNVLASSVRMYNAEYAEPMLDWKVKA